MTSNRFCDNKFEWLWKDWRFRNLPIRYQLHDTYYFYFQSTWTLNIERLEVKKYVENFWLFENRLEWLEFNVGLTLWGLESVRLFCFRVSFSDLDASDEQSQQQKNSIYGLNDEITMYMVWLESLGHYEHGQTVLIEFGC